MNFDVEREARDMSQDNNAPTLRVDFQNICRSAAET